MANNQYVNKVVYGNNTLIDLTSDDVTENDVKQGVTFHLPNGEQSVGTGTGSDLSIYVKDESIIIPSERASVSNKSVVMLPYSNWNLTLV